MSVIRLASHRIELSNLGKDLFPEDGIAKGAVIDHYRHVAGTMLKHARGRLLTMKRFPDGIGGKGFIQQPRSRHFPSWIEGVSVKRTSGKGGRIEHVAGDSTAAIVYLANQAVLEFHGWLSRRPRLARRSAGTSSGARGSMRAPITSATCAGGCRRRAIRGRASSATGARSRRR